jgi:hypothetical protein
MPAPALVNPTKQGVDIVVYPATKFMLFSMPL